MTDQEHASKTVGVRTACRLQFITTPTADTPGTSLIVHFDNKRYIFGEIAEGTQRACIQRGTGLRKVRGLFLTGKTSWNHGGLIGLILSLADTQASEVEVTRDGTSRRPRIDIYAGPKQLHALACARRFIFRTGMPLSVHEASLRTTRRHQKPIHEDENIRVWALIAQHRPMRRSATPATYVSDPSDAEAGPFQDDTVNQSQLDSEQNVRSEIVTNMFNSDWHRDRLSEHKVKDIMLPAVVWVRDSETKELKQYTLFDLEKIAPLTPESLVLVRDPWPASQVRELPRPFNLPNRTSVSYVVKGHPQRGKFDPQKARALGLKPGSDFSELVSGKAVTLANGDVITPSMVMEPGRPARGFAVFDVPSPGYLPHLREQLEEQPELLEGVELIIWLTRDRVPLTEEFQDFVRSLKSQKHVLSHPDVCRDYITQDSSAASAKRLAAISPALFSIPRFNNTTGYRPVEASSSELATLLDSSQSGLTLVPADRGLQFHIEPDFRMHQGEIPEKRDYNEPSPALDPAILNLIPSEAVPDSTRGSASSKELNLSEPEIITLGTGSSAPSKYRNVSATLLRMPDGMGNYLFDCGEGTLGQLKRLFDAEKLDNLLVNLKAIWISHLHADHHLGTTSLLQAVHQTRKRLGVSDQGPVYPPLLLSEVDMKDYLTDYQPILSVPLNTLCIPVVCNWRTEPSFQGKIFDFNSANVPIREVRTVRVNHCHRAQAISVTFQSGFKFSYSGDCRPSPHFCEIGADSDVLVHEATFDDGMEGDALAKKHSTTGEAVGVALQMRAKNLILTHFSQRYSKVPILSNVKLPGSVSEEDVHDLEDLEITTGNSSATQTQITSKSSQSDALAWSESGVVHELPVAIAFDLMHVTVSQIASMRKILPAIAKMFELDEARVEKERLERVAELEAKQKTAKDAAFEKGQSKKTEKLKRKHQGSASGKSPSKGPSGPDRLAVSIDQIGAGQAKDGSVSAGDGEKIGLHLETDESAKHIQTDEVGGAAHSRGNSEQHSMRSNKPALGSDNPEFPEIESIALSPGKRRKLGGTEITSIVESGS